MGALLILVRVHGADETGNDIVEHTDEAGNGGIHGTHHLGQKLFPARDDGIALDDIGANDLSFNNTAEELEFFIILGELKKDLDAGKRIFVAESGRHGPLHHGGINILDIVLFGGNADEGLFGDPHLVLAFPKLATKGGDILNGKPLVGGENNGFGLGEHSIEFGKDFCFFGFGNGHSIGVKKNLAAGDARDKSINDEISGIELCVSVGLIRCQRSSTKGSIGILEMKSNDFLL